MRYIMLSMLMQVPATVDASFAKCNTHRGLNCRVESRRRRPYADDGCIRSVDINFKFVQTRPQLSATSCEFRTQRRRDSTRQLSCVGVGGVHWT